MAKLLLTDKPAPTPDTVFNDAAGKPHTLAEFKGKVAIVNIWANWCAPCKAEIPSLARLAVAYAGKPVAVVPVSVGKGDDETAGRAFIIRNPPLTFYTEPTYALTFAFRPAVDAMPTTVIYDRKGVERARLAGGADWSGPDARAVVDSLLAEK
jgi:thiol-disulfide isomerase/thioredoxin